MKILIYGDINWIDKNEGSGITTKSITGSLDLTVQCINDGKLTISLRSIYYNDINHNQFPIYIDFRKLNVNNKNIFNESIVTHHNKPYRYNLKVKDKEIINIHVEWLPFNKESNMKI